MQVPARSTVSCEVWSPLPSSVVDRINFLATVKLMSTCFFFKVSRKASLLQAPGLREGLDPLLKVSPDLIRPTLPFGLVRLLSLVIDFIRDFN